MTSQPFTVLDLPEAQLANLSRLGYLTMTPIQAAALPLAMAGRDLIAQAKTGSGKTAVFALAILHQLDMTDRSVQALVLCPTRELSLQVSAEMRRLARFQQNIKVTTVYGGQPIHLQKQSLKHGTHIVVGTPGRVKDHLERGSLVLDRVRAVVLDEADRMLEMGFVADMESILSVTPPRRQTLLFSATFPDHIQSLSTRFQRDPERVQVEDQHSLVTIQQRFYHCGVGEKLQALSLILSHYQPASAVVFCSRKQTTREVGYALAAQGVHVAVLHGDLGQREREEVLACFQHQSLSVLVATDVAARGLDIKELPAVIHYDLPPDPSLYIHRIGRTGRAGCTGISIALCTEQDVHKVSQIHAVQQTDLPTVPVETLASRGRFTGEPPWLTFCIAGGRKEKHRPGEILGVLTRDGIVGGSDVGRIDVMDLASFVAVRKPAAAAAGKQLKRGRIKGRPLRVRQLP